MRVAIAEDNAILRDGLAQLLIDRGHEVVAAVADGDALRALVAADPPDVCVVDIRMPPSFTDEGLRAAIALRHSHPDVGVLVFSQYVETRYAAELLVRIDRGVGLPAQGPGRRRPRVRRGPRAGRPGGTALDPEVVAQLLGASRRARRRCDPHPARTRGARADGRRAVQCGHRRGARRDRARRREARGEHLHQVRTCPRPRPTTAGCSPCCVTWSREPIPEPIPEPARLSRKPSTVAIRPSVSVTTTSKPTIGGSAPSGPRPQVNRAWSWCASTGPAGAEHEAGELRLDRGDRGVDRVASGRGGQRVGVRGAARPSARSSNARRAAASVSFQVAR